MIDIKHKKDQFCHRPITIMLLQTSIFHGNIWQLKKINVYVILLNVFWAEMFDTTCNKDKNKLTINFVV